MKIRLDKENVKWGITAFFVITSCILVYFALLRFDTVRNALESFSSIMEPFVWGFVFAYLLCPIYNWCVRKIYAVLRSHGKPLKSDLTIAKVCGTVLSLAILLIVVTGISWMIIPGLYDSIVNIVEIIPASKDMFLAWLDNKLQNFPIAEEKMASYINNSADNLIRFATDTFLPHYTTIASGISSSIIGAVSLAKNIVIGIIVSVYFLNSKDIFAAQLKKLIFAVFKEQTAEKTLEVARFTNHSFGGFISGKIIDSAIIGVICFLFMTLCGWEYSLLISCIIGITNIIPFFGPFIGAIPSILLLVMVNPTHAIYFGIFVIVLQQFDGNILGPKILGESTGIPSFWVLFSVLVGGGLFGVVGMIVGIPIFAVIFYYGTEIVNNRLANKGFSTSLTDYKIDSYRSSSKVPAERRGIVKLAYNIRLKYREKKNEGNDDSSNE